MDSSLRFVAIVIGIAVALGVLVEALEGNLLPSSAPPPVATNHVYVNDSYFSPQVISVKVGVQITWEQRGGITHDVVFTNTPGIQVRSPFLGRGSTFTWTFETAGTYHYLCDLHPNTMKGTVVVQP